MNEHTCNHVNAQGPCPKKVPIFGGLSNEEIQKVAKMTRHLQFNKGEILLHEGEKSDTLFIINKGRVKVSKYTVATGRSKFFIFCPMVNFSENCICFTVMRKRTSVSLL